MDTIPLYAGNPLTLKCTAEVDTSVDVLYTIGVVWLKSGEMLNSDGRRIISNITQSTSDNYEATMYITSMSRVLDEGSYSCQVTVSADSSLLSIQSAMETDMVTITVQGNSWLDHSWYCDSHCARLDAKLIQ